MASLPLRVFGLKKTRTSVRTSI